MLELVEITKTYPGVTALDRVTLTVNKSEVLGLIGENGAGKSTLMKIVAGVIAPASGRIRIHERDHGSLSVGGAIKAGIAFVHQELNLLDNLDVAANVFIGREPLYGGPLRLVDEKVMRQRVQPLLDRLGADFGPDTPVAALSLAERQMLEIAKALSLEARIVIMDEPTSSLTITEAERLLRIVAELRAEGVSVVFISHRLNEVERCADRVVVLRDGRVAGTLERGEIRADAMIRLMIGRDLKLLYTPPVAPPGRAALETLELRTPAYPKCAVSISVRRGEIFGLAGLVGSGRTELARAVFGIDRPLGGAIRLDGREVRIETPRDAIDLGLYLVPEDRKRESLLLDFSIAKNVSLADLRSYAQALIVSRNAERDGAEGQREQLNIKAASVDVEAGTLSGGNQQKVVLARWLSMRPVVIIFDEPTRGIDVGSKSEIYDLMRRLADAGVAILMISSDMEEVIGVSDRIAVMHEGEIAGFLPREGFSEQSILQLAVGKRLH